MTRLSKEGRFIRWSGAFGTLLGSVFVPRMTDGRVAAAQEEESKYLDQAEVINITDELPSWQARALGLEPTKAKQVVDLSCDSSSVSSENNDDPLCELKPEKFPPTEQKVFAGLSVTGGNGLGRRSVTETSASGNNGPRELSEAGVATREHGTKQEQDRVIFPGRVIADSNIRDFNDNIVGRVVVNQVVYVGATCNGCSEKLSNRSSAGFFQLVDGDGNLLDQYVVTTSVELNGDINSLSPTPTVPSVEGSLDGITPPTDDTGGTPTPDVEPIEVADDTEQPYAVIYSLSRYEDLFPDRYSLLPEEYKSDDYEFVSKDGVKFVLARKLDGGGHEELLSFDEVSDEWVGAGKVVESAISAETLLAQHPEISIINGSVNIEGNSFIIDGQNFTVAADGKIYAYAIGANGEREEIAVWDAESGQWVFYSDVEVVESASGIMSKEDLAKEVEFPAEVLRTEILTHYSFTLSNGTVVPVTIRGDRATLEAIYGIAIPDLSDPGHQAAIQELANAIIPAIDRSEIAVLSVSNENVMDANTTGTLKTVDLADGVEVVLVSANSSVGSRLIYNQTGGTTDGRVFIANGYYIDANSGKLVIYYTADGLVAPQFDDEKKRGATVRSMIFDPLTVLNEFMSMNNRPIEEVSAQSLLQKVQRSRRGDMPWLRLIKEEPNALKDFVIATGFFPQ